MHILNYCICNFFLLLTYDFLIELEEDRTGYGYTGMIAIDTPYFDRIVNFIWLLCVFVVKFFKSLYSFGNSSPGRSPVSAGHTLEFPNQESPQVGAWQMQESPSSGHSSQSCGITKMARSGQRRLVANQLLQTKPWCCSRRKWKSNLTWSKLFAGAARGIKLFNTLYFLVIVYMSSS